MRCAAAPHRDRQPHQRAAVGGLQEARACRRRARRARASPPGRARAARVSGIEALAVVLDLELQSIRLEAQPHPGARRRRSAAPRCSAPPAARGRRGWPIVVVDRPRRAAASRRRPGCRAASRPSTDTSRSCSRARAPRGSTGAASATGRGRCRARSARSRRSRAGRRAAASPRARACPARPSIEPIAVRTWPNSSCSSREISRSVDSRVAISVCASSRRSSESVGELREQPPVRANQVQAGRDDGGQRGGEEPVDLPLHLAVDVLHLLRRLLFGLVVLHQQPRDRVLSAACRACSDSRIWARASSPARRAPARRCGRRRPRTARRELARYCALLRRPPRQRHRFLLLQRVVQIEADAIELRRPGGERIGLVGIEHVAHRQRELIQIVLDAQQLQRVAAVAIGQLGLQTPQAGDLAGDVPRIRDHGRERDDQAEEQRRRRRPAVGVYACHRMLGAAHYSRPGLVDERFDRVVHSQY